jgi:hypothetical protein
MFGDEIRVVNYERPPLALTIRAMSFAGIQRREEPVTEETFTHHVLSLANRDLLEQAAAYEIGLGMELDEVKMKIEAAKSKIAERLLGKPAIRNTPEQTTPTPAYLTSSSGQLNLI